MDGIITFITDVLKHCIPSGTEFEDVHVYKTTGRLSHVNYGVFFSEITNLFANNVESGAIQLTVSHDFGTDTIDTLASIQRFDQSMLGNDEVYIEFLIKKADFVSAHAPIQDSYLFLFEENLISLLNYSLQELEEKIKISPRITTFLIADQVYHIENKFLRFVGINDKTLNELNLPLTSDAPSQYDIIDSRRHLVNWEDGPKYLTPNHFYFPGVNQDKPINNVLRKKMFPLCVAYFSNYINSEGLSTLRGYRTVQINSNLPVINHQHVNSLFEIFRWTYDERVHDKIEIVRNLVSIQLGNDAEQNAKILLENASDIFAAVKSNYNLLIKENVGLYFQERGKAETYITDITNQVSKGITDLIDFSSKQLLAFFAAIAGSFATYATNEKEIIVYIGIMLFTFYLLVSSTYYLVYTFRIFKGWESDYKHRTKSWQSVFTPDEINKITSDDELFGQRKILFYKNWRMSMYINLALLLICAVALVYLTNVIDFLFHHKKIEEVLWLIHLPLKG